MSRTRLVVIVLFLGGAAITAFLGFTDSALTELRVAWPPPLVIGLIALLTAKRVAPKPVYSPADWKGADPALLHTLGTLHGFTPAQLEANRAGRLHPEQQAQGIAAGRSDVRFGGVLLGVGQVLLLAGLAVPFFPRALKDVDFTFAWPEKLGVALFVGLFLGGLVGCLPLLFGLVAVRHGLRWASVHRRGTVEAAVGRVELLEVRRSRSGSTYYFVIGNVRLAVSRDAWQAMEKRGGGQYRAYYVNGAFRLLGLEPV